MSISSLDTFDPRADTVLQANPARYTEGVSQQLLGLGDGLHNGQVAAFIFRRIGDFWI